MFHWRSLRDLKRMTHSVVRSISSTLCPPFGCVSTKAKIINCTYCPIHHHQQVCCFSLHHESPHSINEMKSGRIVRIGNVERQIGGGTSLSPHLIPRGYLLERQLLQTDAATAATTSQQQQQRILHHLRWMMAKDNLGQDMLLVGSPSGSIYRQELVNLYAELTGREIEVLTLSADTTESDLKQRRELVTAATTSHHHEIVFCDQAPVRAALHGRLLVLDGIHKAERNVLPTLNNLLENREMNLEDGRFLVSSQRYQELFGTSTAMAAAAAAGDDDDDDTSFLVPVHEDFRVIALGVPAPPFPGNSLDPPLRSRFQIRRIDNPSSEEIYEDLVVRYGISEHTAKLCATLQSAMGTAEDGHAVCFPSYALPSSARILEEFPAEEPISVFSRLYPFGTNKKSSSDFKGARYETSAKLFRRIAADVLLTDSAETSLQSSLSSSYEIQSVERDDHDPNTAIVTFSRPASWLLDSSDENVVVKVPCGKGHILLEDDCFIPTPSRKAALAAMIQEHYVGRNLLLMGPKGEGKSEMAMQFSRMLGYEEDIELFSLHKDMSSLDLLVRRTGSADHGKDGSGWAESPLLRAARTGNLCILDGVEKLSSGCLGTIQSLLTHREIFLPDGRKVSGRIERAIAEDTCVPVHPSFRVIALATQHSRRPEQMRWLTDDVLAMFSTVMVPKLDVDELSVLLSNRFPYCPKQTLELVLKLHTNLTDSVASDCGISMLSLRNLVRLMKQVDPSLATTKAGNLHHLVGSLFVTELLPPAQRDAFRSLLEKMGIDAKFDSAAADEELKVEFDNDNIVIGDFKMPRKKPKRPELVPNPHFVDIPSHVTTIRDLLYEWKHGERSFLLLGNQGVGKNKIVDRICQVAGFEREYIQLHRDSTVGQLTVSPFLENGRLKWKDSPLVRAIIEGSSIIIDEADKAPLEVICLLKNLLEDGELLLPDGRKISRRGNGREGTILVHPDFTAWVLANRPGYPFHGNDFFREVGDCFSSHVIPNPDLLSEIQLLQSYATSVDGEILRRLAASFADLRALSDEGDLSYPYSTREAVSIVKHMDKYPDDSVESILGNVLDIDSYDPSTFQLLLDVFDKHGINVDELRRKVEVDQNTVNSSTEEKLNILYSNKQVADGEASTRPPPLSDPKFGKWDEHNEAHVGGNQWAGGTGGSNTAGLGGRGGAFRLDRGHKVYQVSDEAKAEVSKEAAAAAREIAQAALKERLEEIGMSDSEWRQYEAFLKPIQKDIESLKRTLKSHQLKRSERTWLRNQLYGEIDDSKLVDGAAGEKYIFKRRGMSDLNDGLESDTPRRMRFVLDCSGSMYRFNGYDGRLQRALEVAALIMESFAGMEDQFEYSIVGHSGDSRCIPLVHFGSPPKNAKERMKVLNTMIAHTQFCQSGDMTVPALKQAIIDVVGREDDTSISDQHIVILVSDANLARYGIHPNELTRAIKKGDLANVKAYCVFIASFGREAEEIKQALPTGRGFTCMDTSDLPKIVRNILVKQIE